MRGVTFRISLKGIAMLVFSAVLFSFVRGYDTSPESDVYRFFDAQQGFHREKVWLHLDKPYYGAGDRIWFRGYLVDASTHRADTLSNFVYVELLDRRNKAVMRKKVKRDSTGFSNCLELPARFPAGDYTIRAYTQWMRNFDPDFFFQRDIRIGNSVSDQVGTSVTYVDSSSGRRQAIVRFSDVRGVPYSGADVSYVLHDRYGKEVDRALQKTTQTGAVFIDFPADSSIAGSYAELAFERDHVRYEKTVYFPSRDRRVSIRFYPEGGDLLAGSSQRVAFHAQYPDGRGADVSGAVLNGTGDTVARFAAEHLGMGSFLLQPRAGESYRAVFVTPEGENRTSELPAVHTDGYALSVLQDSRNIRYGVTPAAGFQPVDSLWLVGHTRGQVAFIKPVSGLNPTGRIPSDSLLQGILHLLLIDRDGHPRSERLVFVKRTSDEQWRITADKASKNLRPREKMNVGLTLSDSSGRPLRGDFSISVTDRWTVRADSTSDNIVSNLLLSSDLKGRVESPGWYFGDDPRAGRCLDLVMLTHGWRGFATDSLRSVPRLDPQYFIEHGQYIGGHVKSLMGRDANRAKVAAVVSQSSAVYTAETDPWGRFHMDVDYCDSATFMVSAFTRKNKRVQELKLDKQPPFPPFVYRGFESDETGASMRNYLNKVRWTYFTDGGMRVYSLREFSVEGVDQRPSHRRSLSAVQYDTTKMLPYRELPLWGYLGTRGHLYIHGEGVIGKFGPMKFFIDGVSTGFDQIKSSPLTVDDVQFINMESKFIFIELKRGRFIDPNVFVVRVMGYAESVRFASPVYDTPERLAEKQADARTTLYWNPCVRTDSAGRASIEFYSDDSSLPDYELTIEGMTDDGRPCHLRQRM